MSLLDDLFPDFDPDLFDTSDRRGLIRQTLPGLIEKGYSQRQSRELYRSVGLGIGNQDFGYIYREVTGEEIRSQRIRFVNKDSIPSENIFEPQLYDQEERFKLIGRYDTYIPGKGTQQGYFSYQTNSLDTISNMENDVLNELVERYPALSDVVTSVTIVKGFKKQYT